ncbi:MAG: class I SAM-dependent methyltransferase [Negativicutes bacterium]|nr:class I SAM-dependent methyltransferase [Negativicutes bacterium]
MNVEKISKQVSINKNDIDGRIEYLDENRIEGWAFNKLSPKEKIEIEVISGSNKFKFIADQFRIDLHNAGIDDGFHAFVYHFPSQISRDEINKTKIFAKLYNTEIRFTNNALQMISARSVDDNIDLIKAVKQKTKKTILDALTKQYTSVSSFDKIETGNKYQTIELGTESLKGFRENREFCLKGIDFKQKKVLDLGSNLGEISRLARSLGAEMVDGFEYDPYFIHIANLINSYNDVTRVSFFQRDITDKAVYQGQYDIVLAFSVFTYVCNNIEQISNITNEMFILETHNIEENWEDLYIKPILSFFPYYCVYATTDWGANIEGERMMIAFSKEKYTLEKFIFSRAQHFRWPSKYVKLIDLEKSEFSFSRKFIEWLKLKKAEKNLREVVNDELENVLDFKKMPDYKDSIWGISYWLYFLKGYFEYCEAGEVVQSNAYLVFYKELAQDTMYDPPLVDIINDDEKLIERIQFRYREVDIILNSKLEVAEIEPVLIFNPGYENKNISFYTTLSNERNSCSDIDGYHRIMSSLIFDKKNAPYMSIMFPFSPGYII